MGASRGWPQPIQVREAQNCGRSSEANYQNSKNSNASPVQNHCQERERGNEREPAPNIGSPGGRNIDDYRDRADSPDDQVAQELAADTCRWCTSDCREDEGVHYEERVCGVAETIEAAAIDR